jgi:DNA-binding MarR family transcriptional regulator
MTDQHKFANKWSSAIEEHGYTNIPNLLLFKRKALGITPNELLVIMCIESFRWDRRDPWPSEASISKRAHISTRSVRRLISSLESKQLVTRAHRRGQTNIYQMSPLIRKLDQYAISSLPIGKKRPPGEDKKRFAGRTRLSAKEDSMELDPFKKPINKSGELESLKELISKYPLRPNDQADNG